MEAKRDDLIRELEEKARKIRVHVVRIAGMSDCHTGGSMSIAEILAALYFRVMRVDPKIRSGRDATTSSSARATASRVWMRHWPCAGSSRRRC